MGKAAVTAAVPARIEDVGASLAEQIAALAERQETRLIDFSHRSTASRMTACRLRSPLAVSSSASIDAGNRTPAFRVTAP